MGFLSHLFSARDGGQFLQPPLEAPQLTASDQAGKRVSLADLYALGTVLVFFYPKADTPGCTAQACSLRDAESELAEQGITVVGVSADAAEAQQRFAQRRRLNFTLLSDGDGEIASAFGVVRIPLLGVTTRQAFLIEQGKIIWRDSHASTRNQATDVMNALAEYRVKREQTG